MTQKEQMIIELARKLPEEYGEYKIINPLCRGIGEIMGYEIHTYHRGAWVFENEDEHAKVVKIVDGMEKRGIIKISKSGYAFKMA